MEARNRWKAVSVVFSVLLLLHLATVSSREVPESETATMTVLDVASSLKRAHDILSVDDRTTVSSSLLDSSAPLSLVLHSRQAIHKTRHGDYRSLTRSRLERDLARFRSISNRVSLAVNELSLSDLKPMGSQVRNLSTQVIAGLSQGSGEYFSQIGVGTPARSMYMVIDTGSDINWLQCKPCSVCYSQTDPIFDPARSSSYKPIGCSTTECSSLETSSCNNGGCLYQVHYGDGSYTVGSFVKETLSFGSTGTVNDIALGCGHDNQGLFAGAAGLLGLGGGPLSLSSQLKVSSFSYCLVNRDSTRSSTLDFNAAPPRDSILAPLISNSKINTFYYVGLTGISVGGRLVDIPDEVFKVSDSGQGGIIVDCGTAITRLQTSAYEPLRDAFRDITTKLKLRFSEGESLFDTCYDLSGLTSVRIPAVAFHFQNGRSWRLPATNTMIPVDGAGKYCLAFAPTKAALSILGNVQQQGTRVTFDMANRQLGFSNNKC